MTLEALRTGFDNTTLLEELQGFKQTVIAGAANDVDMAVSGIIAEDTVLSIHELPDNPVGDLKFAVVAGAATTTNIAVTGILTTDVLVGVLRIDLDATAGNIDADDLTSETSITSNGNIQLSTTTTTGDKLMVLYHRPAAKIIDRTADLKTGFPDANGDIQLDTVDTTGSRLLVNWYDKSGA